MLALFPRRGGKPYTYFGVRAMFARYCVKAGVQDFHIHDIRAKALTDAKRQGLDAKLLAGHEHQNTTDHYIKAREVEAATPPRLPSSR